MGSNTVAGGGIRQSPGSGSLDVQCIHVTPIGVVVCRLGVGAGHETPGSDIQAADVGLGSNAVACGCICQSPGSGSLDVQCIHVGAVTVIVSCLGVGTRHEAPGGHIQAADVRLVEMVKKDHQAEIELLHKAEVELLEQGIDGG